MGADVLNTFPVGFTSQPFRDVPLQEGDKSLHTLLTTFLLSIVRESQGILGDAMSQIPVRASPEGSFAEDEFVYANPERPPVDRVQVAFLHEDFWGHVCHRPRHAGEHSAFGIMDGNVEIRQMGVPLFI